MTVTYALAGTSETFDTSLFDFITTSASATVTSDSSNTNGQQRSLKCHTPSGGVNRNAQPGCLSVLADAGSRITFGMRFTALPDSFVDTAGNKTDIIFSATTSGSVTCFAISLDNNGHLRILDKNLTTVGSAGATTLAINTRYRISISYTITSASVNTVKVFINGTLELTATNFSSTISSSAFGLGQIQWDCTTNATDIYFTDIFMDNSSSLVDCGDIRVTAKRPISNGTNNDWTTQIGSGGSGVGTGHSPQVNERALSQTNGWSLVTAGVSKTEEYNIQANSAGDVDISAQRIMGVVGWVFAKASAGNTDSIIVDGTLSNITLTTTAAPFRKVSPNPTTYPAGTGTDIGIKSSTTNTHSLYECGITVAYITPIAPVPGVLNLTLTTFAPTALAPRVVTPAKLSLTLSTFALSVGRTFTPGTKNLTLTKFAPTVLTPRVVVPGVKALTLTRFVPNLQNPVVVIPGVKNLILTEFSPSLVVGHDTHITPGTAHLILTTYFPMLVIPFPTGTGDLLIKMDDYLKYKQVVDEYMPSFIWVLDDYLTGGLTVKEVLSE